MSVLLSIANYRINGTTFEMYGSSYGICVFTISAAIMMSVAIFLFSLHFNFDILKYFGKNSMVYFAFHQSIAMVIARYIIGFVPQETFFEVIFTRILFICCTLFICFFMDIIIRHSKLKFMVGIN